MSYLLHQTIMRSAQRSPDREAIRYLDASLTYGELDRRSNGLARLLRDSGVGRGDRVGILANKSLEIAVAVYGILKAGAAYVPLDATAPVGRLARIMRSCGIRVVVTQAQKRRTIERLAAEETPLVCVVGLAPGAHLAPSCVGWNAIDGPDADAAPETGVIEQDLAYVLYTSGSTGEPKGIMHTHRSALAFAEVAAEIYGFGPEDRISNHAPLHFDLSTLDFFSSAVAGATTVVISEAHTKLPASLSELVETERLTVLYAVPLALIQLLLHGALERRNLGTLRWVLFGGEPFPTKHLRRLMEMLPGARFSNVYGPTEVNGCTYHVVPPLPAGADDPIPIGGLFPNAQALVVDEDDREVAPGTVGELLIRSGTRMCGYWGNPEQTAAATYEHEVPGGYTERFHRTGDLVHERPGGGFMFVGRKDRQIKTRGHRVELDEIEAAILTHPEVEAAAAYAVPDGEGSRIVAASVVLVSGAAERPADLDAHLRAHLPPYAVPARIEVLESFPRTVTGKIDRRALGERATGTPDEAGR